MEQIVRSISTNGRWGLVVVAPAKIENLFAPQRGELVSLGTIEGKQTFQFTPGIEGEGTWYLLDAGDVEAVAGATVVACEDLQSSQTASIVALSDDFACVRSYGYKRRSSRISGYINGQKVDIPSAVLAAMGLISCERVAIKPEIPSLDGSLADALRKAGLKGEQK